MIFKYKPSSFFRGIGNERLKAIFDNFGIELDVDWDNRNPKKDTSVADRWAAYIVPEDKRKDYNKLQEIFQRICIIANSRTNSLAIIRQLAKYGEIRKLPEDFDDEAKWCKAERGAYIYLKEGFDTLKRISELLYANDISYSDHMVDYQTERISFIPSEELLKRLETTISDFFNVPEEDRESRVKMESYPMAGTEQNYFFYTKDGNIENIEMRLLDEKAIELKQVRRPYTIVFTCDNNYTIKKVAEKSDADDNPEAESEEKAVSNDKGKPGTLLSLYVTDLKTKKRDELAEAIVAVLGGQAPKRVEATTYCLDRFADPNYKFPDMTDLGVKECHAKRIGIIAEANDRDEMVFTNLDKHNVYGTMRRCFKWCRNDSVYAEDSTVDEVFNQPFTVSLISISMTTITNKIISFDLRKNSCNRHNYPEEICNIINELIKRMEIEL